MKNHRITFKLFIITALFFIIFISVTLLFQTLFFEKFYMKKKSEDFANVTKKLLEDYKKVGKDENSLLSFLYTFDEKNNTQTVIIHLSEFNDMENNTNIKLYDLAFFPVDKIRSASVIPMAHKEWRASEKLYSQVVKDMKPVLYYSSFLDDRRMVCVLPVVMEDRVEDVIFSAGSLQPVGESVIALNEFFIYIYGATFLLIISLSIIFSIIITKPLLKLKNTALKLSRLDFSTKCDVKSNDEIGDLAGILNFLSDKLGKTLTELKTANEKLIGEIEKEKQLEVMRREFVAGVSHELKTPISLISGYAEALQDDIVKQQDCRYFLDVILDESRKMGYLVNDMLDLSQLESGNFKLHEEKFDLVELVNRVLRKFSQQVCDKNIVLETIVSHNHLLVSGDIFRIEQVLVNFMSNALRHTPGGGRIIVHAYEEKEQAIFEVENQGEHIPEDELDKIWEKFYKVDKSRNREAEGTGVGLAIVKNILELHGSTYGVTNTAIGVKFYFKIAKMKWA